MVWPLLGHRTKISVWPPIGQKIVWPFILGHRTKINVWPPTGQKMVWSLLTRRTKISVWPPTAFGHTKGIERTPSRGVFKGM
jgi:membrane protease YdiL (CAAX protease family)